MSGPRRRHASIGIACALFGIAASLVLPSSEAACTDSDADGFQAEPGCDGLPVDCNDAAPLVFPGAPEACNGFDDDCDGSVDDAPACHRRCEVLRAVRPPLSVAPSAFFAEGPAIAWAGDEFGLSFGRFRQGAGELFRPWLVRVAADGAAVAEEVALADAAWSTATGRRALGWTGRAYAVARDDAPDYETRIVFQELVPHAGPPSAPVAIGGPPFPYPSDGVHASLAWAGGGYGVTWTAVRGSEIGVSFARLDAEGRRVGDVVVVTSEPNAGPGLGRSRFPSLVWSGNAFGLAWLDWRDGQSDVWFVELDSEGRTLFDPRPVQSTSGLSRWPVLRWTGGGWALAWYEWDFPSPDARIELARLAPAGGTVEVSTLTTEPGFEGWPDLAWTGQELLVTWVALELDVAALEVETGAVEAAALERAADALVERSLAQGSGGRFAARVSAGGARLGPRLELDAGATGSPAALAWDGSGYGVGWADGTDIRFQRIGCGFDVALSVRDAIHPRSNGVIRVVVHGEPGLDVGEVDLASLAFGPAGAEPIHDVVDDADGDGTPDLSLHFRTHAAGIACGDSSVSLSGSTFAGQPLAGSAPIRTVGCTGALPHPDGSHVRVRRPRASAVRVP